MISRVARIEISLRARSRWLPFLLAIGAASLLLAAETLLVGTVFSFESPSTGHLMLALDSDDPWLQFRLGQVSKDTDPAESVRRLRRATELSPHSRFYWENLAAACESTGDTQCADQATERLLKLCPMVPYYHQLAGQSYLRRNRLDDALGQFRRLIELGPVYASEAWGSLQSVLDPDLIFQKLLAGGKDSQVQAESKGAASSAPTSGMDSKVQVEYVDFLSNQVNNDAAYRIWRLVAANRRLFPLSSAQPYLERLIDLGRIEEAARVWQDLEHLGIVTKPAGDQEDNLVFNGDFEQLPLNAGFD